MAIHRHVRPLLSDLLPRVTIRVPFSRFARDHLLLTPARSPTRVKPGKSRQILANETTDGETGLYRRDLDDRTAAEPHQLWPWIFQEDTDRKALRHPHPIERALDIRNRARNTDAILIRHALADILHHPIDRHVAVDDGEHRGAVPIAITLKFVSRKFATTNHSSVLINMNNDCAGAIISPIEMVRPTTKPL